MPGLKLFRRSWPGILGQWFLLPAALLLIVPVAGALDPPHDVSWAIDCSSCHTTHNSAGGSLTTVGGNGNLCLSCHVLGGLAAAFPFVDADQAFPAPGLPPGTSASGSSHRWDSGAAGHVKPDVGNTSVGEVVPGGRLHGKVPQDDTQDKNTRGGVRGAVF